MSATYDHGPLDRFEVTWMSGHVETVEAHQVTFKSRSARSVALANGMFGTEESGARVQFHGEIDGHWTLVLSALDEDIRTIRRVTAGEQVPGGGSR